MTVQVIPTAEADQELANELVVITNHPHLKTEHEARLQWEELSRSLQQFELNVSRPEVRAAPPLRPAPRAGPSNRIDEPIAHVETQNNVR